MLLTIIGFGIIAVSFGITKVIASPLAEEMQKHKQAGENERADRMQEQLTSLNTKCFVATGIGFMLLVGGFLAK